MRPNEFLVVLFVAVLAVGGCTVNLGDSDTPTAGPPPTTPAPPAAESGPQLAFLQIGDKYDGEAKEVTNQTDTFTPATPVIEVNAGIKGLETGATITGTITAVEVTMKDGTKVMDEEVASTDMEAPGEESTVHFSFSAPTAGWPKGSYKVEIAVEGETIETADVTVQ